MGRRQGPGQSDLSGLPARQCDRDLEGQEGPMLSRVGTCRLHDSTLSVP